MLLDGGSSTNPAALPAKMCKLCHSKGACAHHQPLQQLLLAVLWARGTSQWAPCAGQCVKAAEMHRTAQQGSQAPNSDKNKLLSHLTSSPVLLVVPWCSTHGIILVGRDLWGSSKSSVSQLAWLTLGKLSTVFTEVLGESDWCLGWEEDGEMGRTVPSSSEQLELLSCSGEWALQVAALLQKNGQFFFSLSPGKQRRAQGERRLRTGLWSQ